MDSPVTPDPRDASASPDNEVQDLRDRLAQAEALYDHSPCGSFSLDSDLRFTRVNRTLLDWLGYSREELLDGMSAVELVAPNLRDQAQSRFDMLRLNDTADPIELDLLRKDGSRLQAMLISSAVRDAEGQFVCSTTTVVDLTHQHAVQRYMTSHGGIAQAITDRIPARLAYYDKDLICRFANATHATRYGKQPHEMVGLHLSQVVRPEVLPEILPKIASALSGEAQTFEAEHTSSDGNRYFYEIHYIPDTRNGSVEGIFIELHDITERRRTEELVLEANRDLEERVRERSAELYRSEQRFRLMIDALQDYCIYFIDEQGLVTEWSDSAQRMHGHARQQIVGQVFSRLMATDNAGEEETDPEQVLRLAVEHGQWESRGWRLREDGSRFWAHSVVTALRNEGGELQGLSVITRDMTAAKHLEDVMNDLNKELEKRVAERTQQLVAANKDLDVFSHMVSHDLRAPLRHITSFVNLLQEHVGENPDPVTEQYLNSIVKASKRMSQMIEGLLEYARLGRVAIEAQPVPLAPLVEGIINHLKQENPQRQIEWAVDQDLPVVRGDPMLLAEVFGNLLGNSVKFTRTRPEATIRVGWQVNPVGGRTFYVHDNGVGFDLEKAHNLFVMFQRQHHSMDYEGNGTGLALSQRIIERHGGRIWAETAPGQGCTFFFTLPFEGLEPPSEFPKSTMADLVI